MVNGKRISVTLTKIILLWLITIGIVVALVFPGTEQCTATDRVRSRIMYSGAVVEDGVLRFREQSDERLWNCPTGNEWRAVVPSWWHNLVPGVVNE